MALTKGGCFLEWPNNPLCLPRTFLLLKLNIPQPWVTWTLGYHLWEIGLWKLLSFIYRIGSAIVINIIIMILGWQRLWPGGTKIKYSLWYVQTQVWVLAGLSWSNHLTSQNLNCKMSLNKSTSNNSETQVKTMEQGLLNYGFLWRLLLFLGGGIEWLWKPLMIKWAESELSMHSTGVLSTAVVQF